MAVSCHFQRLTVEVVITDFKMVTAVTAVRGVLLLPLYQLHFPVVATNPTVDRTSTRCSSSIFTWQPFISYGDYSANCYCYLIDAAVDAIADVAGQPQTDWPAVASIMMDFVGLRQQSYC